MALRPDTARLEPHQGGPARPRLLRRRPEGRRPAARLPRRTRRHGDLPQPDLRRRLEPRLRHPGLHARSTRTSATAKDWEKLVKHAQARGIRVILDGVFNHMSSDSPLFDRYHHYRDHRGLRVASARPWRSWFDFLNAERAVRRRATTQAGSASTRSPCCRSRTRRCSRTSSPARTRSRRAWLEAGAGGWRLDVSGDPSFPSGYWEAFRGAVKATRPDALTISETWQKDTTLLRILRGDRLDTTMNYRLRDAVLGLLAPNPFDTKGFADSGHAARRSRSSPRGSRRFARTTPTRPTTR